MKRALLHGFLGDPSVWDGIVGDSSLGESDRTVDSDVVIVLPGHVGGEHVRPTWAENLDAIAQSVRGCDLAIGYSLGARVTLGLLAMGAIPRAILISANPGIDDAARSARRASDAIWARKFRTEPLADVLDEWEAQPLFASQARVAPDVLAARRARRLRLDSEQLARSLEVMGLAEMPDYRGVVDARCTLIVGGEDAKYLAIARGLGASLVIDHCGHDPLLEQPAALAKVLASLS